MTRARFSPFAASCLLALALGALACGIFAALLSKADAPVPLISSNHGES